MEEGRHRQVEDQSLAETSVLSVQNDHSYHEQAEDRGDGANSSTQGSRRGEVLFIVVCAIVRHHGRVSCSVGAQAWV